MLYKVYEHSKVIRSELVAIFQHITIYAFCTHEIIRNCAYGKFKNALICFGHWRCEMNRPISGFRTFIRFLRIFLQQRYAFTSFQTKI